MRELAPVDETMGSDPASIDSQWISLDQHLTDVEGDLATLFSEVDLDLDARTVSSAVAAGRWHDLGKAHPVFQATMANTARPGEEPPIDAVWAKAGGTKPARHSRPFFRHELASALALLGEARSVIEPGLDFDLVLYLVAAHHGRVRLSIRSYPTEEHPDRGLPAALGVHEGDVIPAGTYGGVAVPAATLSLSVMTLGAAEGSWVARSTALRDRIDLGIFRLGHLEALLRLADWRISAGYGRAPAIVQEATP